MFNCLPARAANSTAMRESIPRSAIGPLGSMLSTSTFRTLASSLASSLVTIGPRSSSGNPNTAARNAACSLETAAASADRCAKRVLLAVEGNGVRSTPQSMPAMATCGSGKREHSCMNAAPISMLRRRSPTESRNFTMASDSAMPPPLIAPQLTASAGSPAACREAASPSSMLFAAAYVSCGTMPMSPLIEE
ncbi:Uncharacterised protein [Mycobacteroides abscessus subsp. abscessus]|nr:Uncharacterised protein [Mycobacteroides abscessus subsp. abscessus]